MANHETRLFRIASICCLLLLADTARSQEGAPHKNQAAQIKMFSLQNASAEQLLDVIDTIFGEERFRIAADKRTNTVIIKARPDVASAVEAVISRLDENKTANPKRKIVAQPKPLAKRRIVRPRDTIEIHSEIRGTTVIRSLVPDGARVRKGDLLVQLDDSKLAAGAKTLRSEIEILKAEFATVQQHGNVHDASEVNMLESALKIAKLRLEHFEAEWKFELLTAEGETAVARATLRFAQDHQLRSEQLAESGQGSTVDALAAAADVTKAKVEYELAEAKKELIEQSRALRLAELRLEARQQELNLTRARRETEAQKLETQTKLQVLDTKLQLKSKELERIQHQIEKCKVVSPGDGTVRYPGKRGPTGETLLKQGATVREGQRLVLLAK